MMPSVLEALPSLRVNTDASIMCTNLAKAFLFLENQHRLHVEVDCSTKKIHKADHTNVKHLFDVTADVVKGRRMLEAERGLTAARQRCRLIGTPPPGDW